MKPILAKITALRPVRVFAQFTDRGGSVLAGGMSFQAIFAVFAALWVGFSIAGLFVTNSPAITEQLYATINRSVPGLIGADGVIDPESLKTAGTTLRWTGAIALAGLLLTALGWLSTTSFAVRRMFGMPKQNAFILLLKARELVLGLLFGLALLLSALVSLASTAALDTLFGLVGISQQSIWYQATARSIGVALVLVIDSATLAALFRVLSRVRIPLRRLVVGSVFGGVALGVLKILGGTLLGGATRNPLLATFAVIIGLLIWFNLVSTVILLAASWISVGMSDAGIPPESRSADEKAAAKSKKEEQEQRAHVEAELTDARRAYVGFPWWRRSRATRRVREAVKAVKNLPPETPR
ncbi:YihY/virulence factor BrkB family protein [Cryobacterium psychrophilum]|uniref:YihY/virulence factor BrkB family protein n=1 Tax=Cryobacterium psychrophilum TaxID=41988 RepID=A0A4Y8KQB1_9MICO|nr:YihY/virulence factor BrkB family protein [Cryobacterium psychrophilum]TDW30646.1 membrane protein [Cryobacterium psychrophilum]TFD77066.1 YihY/virulence factor BrkB family protein [Cryobacterium psychrophilum]